MFDIQQEFDKKRGLRLKVARALGITHGAVSQWKQVPATRADAVAKLIGVPAHLLRPDVFPNPAHHERESA